jgi:hypothetical protein
MLATYRAILRADRLEWSEEVPASLASEQGVRVHVTLLEPLPETMSAEARGQRMAAALERLAARRAFSEITDPVSWQREIRQDRPLPAREP